jgi:hypothetical protein
MLDLARYRLPEWTDQSPSDLGVLLVDLFAYMGDIILYYQDRIASESFLATATERRSVLHLLRLIGYEMQGQMASSADLLLTFKAPGAGEPTTTSIPTGARFETKPAGGQPAHSFEYTGPALAIDLASSLQITIPVTHGKSATPEVFSASGVPNLALRLSQPSALSSSIQVEVNEGAGFRKWTRRTSLLYYESSSGGGVALSGPDSEDFYVQTDEEGRAWVLFGDGVYGRMPNRGTNNIRVSYRTGGGAAGNVPAGAITEKKTEIRALASVSNPNSALGGADPESIEHAIRFGPLAFRSGQRAVTLNDFVSLAQQAGGVAKVRARSRGWNQIDLFVAPEGSACGPAPEALKQRLLDFFESRRMVGTFLSIEDPVCVSIDISVSVLVEHNFEPFVVQTQVDQAIRQLLAFENVDFGRPLYLSKVYESVESLPGVAAATVTRFRRQGRALQQVEADGRIEIGEFELPRIGALSVVFMGESA